MTARARDLARVQPASFSPIHGPLTQREDTRDEAPDRDITGQLMMQSREEMDYAGA
jgi:hypothetical protein